MWSSFPLKNRLLIFLLMLISTILVGSLGYVIIKTYVEHESTSLTNAIFFSIATISTLGHYPRGIELTSDVGKWFTILYLILGMGTIFGGIQALVSPWIEMKIRNAVKERKIPIPKDAHVVLCGWNDIAREVGEYLQMVDIPFVIVAKDAPLNFPGVNGDPGNMNALKLANVERASALIALLDEKKNVVITLTARRLNREMRIIALSEREESKNLLIKSGVDVVISREKLLRSLLDHWIKGDFTHIFSGEIFGDLKIKELSVGKDMAGKSLKELRFRERVGTAIGIYRRGLLITNPKAEEILKEGDIVIFMEGENHADTGIQ